MIQKSLSSLAASTIFFSGGNAIRVVYPCFGIARGHGCAEILHAESVVSRVLGLFVLCFEPTISTHDSHVSGSFSRT
jgi:hypothetical protein